MEWGVVQYLGEESIPPPTSFTVLTWRTANRPTKRGRDIDQKCSNYGSVSVSALYNVRMNKKLCLKNPLGRRGKCGSSTIGSEMRSTQPRRTQNLEASEASGPEEVLARKCVLGCRVSKLAKHEAPKSSN